MTVDQGGNEQVDATTRKLYDEHDRKVDEYIEALLKCLIETPTPKMHQLPPGTNRMRYASIERALMTAHSTLYRDFMRWKEGRS